MVSVSILRWPWMALALFIAGIFCLASPGWAGLLVSQTGDTDITGLSRQKLEKEIVALSLEKMGWNRKEAEIKLTHLSEKEIHDLSTTLDKITAGGEEDQGKRALGVGLVIVLVLAGITGIYLFSQANK
ncbi:MAG: PA2779 family protein [Candidatus Auribacterota bacterium]|nr:PA2779 family protein [Candidatus Auribacterota bacterium]